MGTPKVLLFDIETTNLSADFGTLLCCGFKFLGIDRKPWIVTIRQFTTDFANDPTNDKRIVGTILDIINQADVLVGWYSSKFDYPYIQSKAILHGLPPLPPLPHIDGWRIARYKMALSSNRLKSAAAFLGLSEKTTIKPNVWRQAGAGNVAALKYVEEHCLQDIVVLEEVYNRIKPLLTSCPNLAIISNGECPICGGAGLEKRGISILSTGTRQRYQCKKCGGWSKGPIIRAEKIIAR